ncbi:MAG TPA: biotin/lipoyl-binding protein, partial [Caldithrix abyssi]|nr:biotin/lipoyl-binding protein [Caldithrix abyssi]
MKFEMVMPKMGESITEGTILKWLKKEGDTVGKDEIILEISTDKVDSEIPTPVPGKIVQILAQEGDTVEVGKPIAVIETEAAAQAETAEPPAPQEETAVTQEETQPAVEPAPAKTPPKQKGKRFYSPVVMKIAAEENISMAELESLTGSGVNGRVTKKDVLAYLKTRQAPVAATPASTQTPQVVKTGSEQIIPLDNMRRKIAEHMIHSKHTSAHVSLYTEVDMLNIDRIR